MTITEPVGRNPRVQDRNQVSSSGSSSNTIYRLPGVSEYSTSAGLTNFPAEDVRGNAIGELIPRTEVYSGQYLYDGYGVEANITAPPAGTTSFRFIGKKGYQTDFDSGLVICGARMYIPGMGRFLTQDPTGHIGGLNLYEYCRDNPVGAFDPTGEDARTWASLVGNFAGELIGGPIGGAVGSGLGSLAGSLIDGDSLGTAAINATVDSATGLIGGQIAKYGAQFMRAAGRAGGVTVYRALNTEGDVIYVGITSNLRRRSLAHAARFEIREIPGLTNLSRADARAVEQALIEYHVLGKNGGSLLNKINSIAATNPIFEHKLARGYNLLRWAKYRGIR